MMINNLKQKQIFFYFSLIASMGYLVLYSINTDIFRPYTAAADCDFYYVAQVLDWFSNLDRLRLAHGSAHFFVMLHYWWAMVMSEVINLDTRGIVALLTEQNIADLFSPFTFIGRIFSLVLAEIFLLVFALVSYKIFRSKYIILLSIVIFASTQGILIHLNKIRPELLSSMLLFIGVYALYQSQKSREKTLMWAFIGGVVLYLSILAKIQSVIGIVILPLVLFLFWSGSQRENGGTINAKDIYKTYSEFAPWVRWLVVLLFIYGGVYHLFFIVLYGGNFLYQVPPLIMVFLVLSFVFCHIFIKDLKATGVWLLFLGAGIGFASLVYLYKSNPLDIFSSIGFIGEFSNYRGGASSHTLIHDLIFKTLTGFKDSFLSNFDLREVTKSPLILLYFSATTLCLYQVFNKRYSVLVGAGFFILGFWQDIFFTFRPSLNYLIYVEGVKIIGSNYLIYVEGVKIIGSLLIFEKSIKAYRATLGVNGMLSVLLTFILLFILNNQVVKNNMLYPFNNYHSANYEHINGEGVCLFPYYLPRFQKFLELNQVKGENACKAFIEDDFKKSRYFNRQGFLF